MMSPSRPRLQAVPPLQRLPGELRMMIWQYALPQYTGTVLHVYPDEEAWDRTVVTEADSDCNRARPNESANISLVFHADRLCQTRYEVPMAFACKESYQAVRTWARAHGLKASTNAERLFPYFIRPFDPVRDTLYVPTATFGDFLASPYERASQSDMVGQLYHNNATSLRRLAIHGSLLREGHWARDLFDSYFAVRELLVIVQEPHTQEPIEAAAFIEYEALPASFLWEHGRAQFHAVDQASAPQYTWVPATLAEVTSALRRARREELTVRLIRVTQIHGISDSARLIRLTGRCAEEDNPATNSR